MEDSDVSLPKATIVKLIKESLPTEMRIAGDATDIILACCTEFIAMVSSEANEMATQEKKQTIQPEHVLKALTEMGFQDFVEEVTTTWHSFKDEAKSSLSHKASHRKTRADQEGMTEQQQIELQQRMFAAARAASMTSQDDAAAMAAAYQARLAALRSPGGSGNLGAAISQAQLHCASLPTSHSVPAAPTAALPQPALGSMLPDAGAASAPGQTHTEVTAADASCQRDTCMDQAFESAAATAAAQHAVP